MFIKEYDHARARRDGESYEDYKERQKAEQRATPVTARNLGGVLAFRAAIATPEGMTREERDDSEVNGYPCKRPFPVLEFKDSLGTRIMFRFTREDELEGSDDVYSVATGHVYFKVGEREYTFDRHGISDSFYVDMDYTVDDVAAEVADQLEQVREERERAARSITVPGLPLHYEVTPEEREQISAALGASGSYHFTPSGMGTGADVSRRKKSRWARQLPQETAAFFNQSVLYYEPTDCD